MNILDSIKPALEILTLVVGMVSALLAALTYRSNSKRERAKWAVQLFEKFYESDQLYRNVREELDSDAPSAAVHMLVEEQSAKFTDYLNFFEMIAFLVDSDQLAEKDVLGLFQYYLDCLKRHTAVMLYVHEPDHGFEYLTAFLGKVSSTRRT